MFLRLTPIKLRLYALITLEIKLPFLPLPLKYILLKAKLWEYQTATIRKLLIDNTKAEEDKSPPKLESFGVRRFLAISVIKKKKKKELPSYLYFFIHIYSFIVRSFKNNGKVCTRLHWNFLSCVCLPPIYMQTSTCQERNMF